jgi:DNA helicase-2/ATP-dependent DNA helicase PcrA
LGEKAISNLPAGRQVNNQLSLLEWQKLPESPINQLTSQPVNYLSYSQIETFDTCPLQYRYRYIQRIPVTPSGALSFGDAIHKTLFAFYKAAKEGKNPTKKDLLKILEENWSSVGYASKAHEMKMKKQGEEILANFYEKAYDPKHLPKDLEQMFTIKISPNFKIGGKIDRVDELPDGKLEIIDYKTGKVPSEEKIDKNLQMTIYALAAQDEGIYGRNPEEVILSFYFLDTQEKISLQRTRQQLEEAKKVLLSKKKEIESSDFSPKPSNLCDFCEFRLLCEAWQ